MNTRTIALSVPPLPIPALVPSMPRLLLTQYSSLTRPTDPDTFSPELLTLRATHIGALLSEMLEEKGYRHAGLNE